MSEIDINDPWLLKFQPNEDELLSSWLIRLINAHGALVHTFCRQLWPGVPIWTKDIDLQPNSLIVDKLMMKTGYDKSLVSRTTLRNYEGKFYNQLHQGTNNWVLPLGLYHRVRNRKAQQFCPDCLSEDIRPYFRKKWRLSCYTTCPKHNKELMDSCPNCSNNIVPNKLLWNHSGIPYCNHCNHNLTKIPKSTNVAAKNVQKFHIALEQIRTDGYAIFNGIKISGVDFMYGLRIFLSALTRKNYNRKLLKFGTKISNIPLKQLNFIDERFTQFEHLGAQDRRLLIEILSNLIYMPTDQFVLLMRQNRIGSSCFYGTEYQNFPPWLISLMEKINLNKSYS